MNLLERIGATAWAQGFRPVNCGSHSCSRWLTHRQLSVRCVGVTMAETWYCSYRCFRATAQRHIAQLLALDTAVRERPAHPPLGLALVRYGLLTDSQYKTASQIERQSGAEIGGIIVRLGMLTEKQVTRARAAQWSCSIFPRSTSIERSAFRIPSILMQRYFMVPLHYASTGNRLFVGFVYEVDYEALYAIEKIMGCATQPCFLTPEEFKKILAAHPALSLWDERDDSISRDSSELTDALCAYGVSIDADSVTVARCGEIVWSRLKAGSRTSDLLFTAAASMSLVSPQPEPFSSTSHLEFIPPTSPSSTPSQASTNKAVPRIGILHA